MNYDHVNKISDYFRDVITPHLTSRIGVSDFGDYLTKIAGSPSFRWMRHELRAFPINYFVDPEKFMKKHAKSCVGYAGSSEPREGAMQVVFQLSTEFHVLARLYNWVEKEEVKAYFMLTVVYRNHKDFTEFFDDNKELRLTGNTDDKGHVGFAAAADDARGFASLIKRMAEENPLEDSEKDS